jgi:hypothetical protein
MPLQPVARSSCTEYALAGQVRFRPSVHLAFDHLDPADEAFHDAGDVGHGMPGGGGSHDQSIWMLSPKLPIGSRQKRKFTPSAGDA